MQKNRLVPIFNKDLSTKNLYKAKGSMDQIINLVILLIEKIEMNSSAKKVFLELNLYKSIFYQS